MLNLRKQFVVDKALQYSIVKHLVIYGLVLSIVFLSLLYFISTRFIDELARADVDSLVLIKFFDGVNQMAFFFFALVLLITILTGYFSLYFSNKIAGPIYNIERTLDANEKNQENAQIRLRKNDYFSNLATKINRLIEKNQKT